MYGFLSQFISLFIVDYIIVLVVELVDMWKTQMSRQCWLDPGWNTHGWQFLPDSGILVLWISAGKGSLFLEGPNINVNRNYILNKRGIAPHIWGIIFRTIERLFHRLRGLSTEKGQLSTAFGTYTVGEMHIYGITPHGWQIYFPAIPRVV
jgi:hypothetical protein